jgi:hypothetical protein
MGKREFSYNRPPATPVKAKLHRSQRRRVAAAFSLPANDLHFTSYAVTPQVIIDPGSYSPAMPVDPGW